MGSPTKTGTLRYAGRPGSSVTFPMRVGIALGSNVGDRADTLRKTCDILRQFHESPGPFLISRFYETDPVDCAEGTPAFLNAAVELTSSLPPLDLLARLQQIETDFGRPRLHGHHEPRTLDLDFLYCDNIQISLPSLTLPHPRISERLFVLQPLRDICPDRILPHRDRSIRSLCDALENPCWPEV